jgi:beta-galactosidase
LYIFIHKNIHTVKITIKYNKYTIFRKFFQLIAVRFPHIIAIKQQLEKAMNTEQQKLRRKIIFNFDWKFHRGDLENAESPEFDDNAWEDVDLPHDWSIYGAFDEEQKNDIAGGFRPRGIGWHRKTFQTPENSEGKKLFIEFEGIYMAPDIWLNDIHLGKRYNGYLGFQYDIGNILNPPGCDNIIAARSDNTVRGTSRWYTGSGIYRNVWLIQTEPIHIARHGVFIRTENNARVLIDIELRNETGKEQKCAAEIAIKDSSGNCITETSSNYITIEKDNNAIIKEEIDIPSPKLWSTDDPNLYTAEITIKDENDIYDVCAQSFGVRDIRFDPDRGLILNGKKVFAKGINLHHDLGCLGAAAFERGFERRLELMKEMGCNAIRLSHNPHAECILDLCDRMGILVFNEAFDKWNDLANAKMKPFEETWKDDLIDFIKRDRNHPSVFIWSVGNEVTDQQLFGKDNFGVDLLKRMTDTVRQTDPTRKTTCALFPAREKGMRYDDKKYPDSEPAEMAHHMDVVSVNYMERFFSKDREKYPEMIFILSEAFSNGGAEAWFSYDQSFVAGQFYWGGIEYIGEAKWPKKGWHRGHVDRCCFRKPISYYLEATYSDKPMAHIAIYNGDTVFSDVWNDVKLELLDMESHWNWQPGEKLKLATYTNCETLELFLNEKSLGIKKIGDCPNMLMEWEIGFTPGLIKAVGRNNGEIAAVHELRTAENAEKIRLVPDRKNILANGLDLAHITVELIDKDGTLVPHADNLVSFKVSGAGTNAGVDNGNVESNELWQADFRKAHKGKALLVIRSKRETGKITIIAESEGISPAKLELVSTQA